VKKVANSNIAFHFFPTTIMTLQNTGWDAPANRDQVPCTTGVTQKDVFAMTSSGQEVLNKKRGRGV
jgi:hypothetical protein